MHTTTIVHYTTPTTLHPIGSDAAAAAGRECHGLANPHGSRVRVVAGAGAGCKIPTRDQPSPAARVTQTRCGLSFSPSGWARDSFFDISNIRLLHPSRCHPWKQVAAASRRCSFAAQCLSTAGANKPFPSSLKSLPDPSRPHSPPMDRSSATRSCVWSHPGHTAHTQSQSLWL
ncbi:hypothetical protein BGY98DRAFT_244188 [Russula aff. rugulosa BPL654]|nr:hypothetical protein BGY98DRAFT_244188 [Russula aff. rugulosa BPL654]